MANMTDKLLGYIRDWLDRHFDDFADDTECLFDLARSISERGDLPKITLVELRKIYDAEKAER